MWDLSKENEKILMGEIKEGKEIWRPKSRKENNLNK